MIGKTTARLGGICAVLVAASYLVVGITYFLLPSEQRPGFYIGDFYSSVADDSTVLTIEFWAFALGALFAIAVVIAVAELLRSDDGGLVRWVSTLAIIGLAVVAVQYLILQDQIPDRAGEYNKLQDVFVGIGSEIEDNHDGDIVLAPLPNQPAALAGLVEGDIVVTVDGRDVTSGVSTDDVAALIRGPAGADVTLTVRSGDGPLREVTVTRREIDTRADASAATVRSAMRKIGSTNLDPDNWIGFGLVGLWLLVVNWLAMRGGQLPRVLTYIGMAGGISLWLVVAASGFGVTILIAIAAGLGGIVLGPIWYVWTGVVLWRMSR